MPNRGNDKNIQDLAGRVNLRGSAKQPSQSNWTLVHFVVCGQHFAIPVFSVVEVLHIPELTRPPGRPSFLEGFLNLAGKAIPVVKLASILDLDAAEPGIYSHIIVLKQGYALLVDSVQSLFTSHRAKEIETAAELSMNGCVRAYLRLNDLALNLLDLDKILLTQETLAMEEFAELENVRLTRLKGAS